MSDSGSHTFKSFDSLPSLKKQDSADDPVVIPPQTKSSPLGIEVTVERQHPRSPNRAFLERKDSTDLLAQRARKLQISIDEDTAKIKRLRAEVARLESEKSDRLTKQAEELSKAREKAEAELPEARLRDLEIREAQIHADLATAKQLEETAASKLAEASVALELVEEERKSIEQQIDPLKVKIKKLQADLRESRKAAQDLAEHGASLQRSNSRYKTRVAKAEAEAAELRDEVNKLNRQARKRVPQNGKLADRIAEETGRLFAHCPKTQLWLLSLERPGHRDMGWSDTVVTLGHDPLDDEFLDVMLTEKQFTPVDPGYSDASVVIVGREGCKMSDVYKQIAARRNAGLKVYSQEMAFVALATGCDPFDAGNEALEEMGRSHPVLSELMQDAFEWPALTRRRSPGGTVIKILNWNSLSPLTAMGYHTGREFTNARERRDRLADIVEGRLIFPDGFSAKRKDEWGIPGSRKRIKKVALQLVQNITLPGQSPFLGLAAKHWESDYEWLKRQYPEGGSGGWPLL